MPKWEKLNPINEPYLVARRTGRSYIFALLFLSSFFLFSFSVSYPQSSSNGTQPRFAPCWEVSQFENARPKFGVSPILKNWSPKTTYFHFLTTLLCNLMQLSPERDVRGWKLQRTPTTLSRNFANFGPQMPKTRPAFLLIVLHCQSSHTEIAERNSATFAPRCEANQIYKCTSKFWSLLSP